jgi:hypothetical protein
MKDLHHLKVKGWKAHEIKHAQKILKHAEENKHPKIVFLEKISFWFNLAIILIASVLFASLSTSMVYLTEYVGYALTAFIAIIIGTLFTSTFDHLDALEMHHHIWTIATIAVVSTLAYALSSSITKVFITSKYEIHSATYSPWLLALTYTLFFLIPYVYHLWHDNYINSKMGTKRHGA